MSLVRLFLGILLAIYVANFNMSSCSSSGGNDDRDDSDSYSIGVKRSMSPQSSLSAKRAKKVSIFDAIGDGDYALVQRLMSRREFDIDIRNGLGQTPLIVAAQYGDSRMVEILLEHCVSVYGMNSFAGTESGACDIMCESLIAMDQYDRTALAYAVERNNIFVIRVLTEYCNRNREQFEEQMMLFAALIPELIDGEDNPYLDEIHGMLIEPSAIRSAGEHTHDFIEKIVGIQKLIEQLSGGLGDVLLGDDYTYRYVPKKKLKEKSLSWLRTRYNKLLQIRDAIYRNKAIKAQQAASMALLKIKEKTESTLTAETETEFGAQLRPAFLQSAAEMPALKSCFACCATGDGVSIPKIDLLPIPCKYCSGKEVYVCCECLSKLHGICSFCMKKFDDAPTP